MKTRFASGMLILSLLISGGFRARAQTAPPPAAPPRELTVVVSESLDRSAEGFSTFSATRKVFTSVFNRRGWPVKINVERFASNNPDYDYELRVYFRGVSYETPGVLTLRAWMTLFDHGKEHDFGIIKSQLNQNVLDHRQDSFEDVLRHAAEIAADKIEPILFPKTEHNP
jgi:hypothetical protein